MLDNLSAASFSSDILFLFKDKIISSNLTNTTSWLVSCFKAIKCYLILFGKKEFNSIESVSLGILKK